MHTRSERWFVRFARTADPHALARVFDATAPELWRVAAHLCRTREDAEDAVQAAFLLAIEHAPRWDRERPLLPWLLGILVNRVRTQRRSRRVIDAVQVVERDEPDPARLAADREFQQLALTMIERVDEPFRTVLVPCSTAKSSACAKMVSKSSLIDSMPNKAPKR
jgi:RNA polymerase sigma-70 factor (ECF subfamily)